jgi:hypothetical protein
MSIVTFSAGIGPQRAAAVEVVGRSSGRVLSSPVVVTDWNGEPYLVSMLGERADWVRNARATWGRAVLRRGKREAVVLINVVPAEQPPIVRRYLTLAPRARPHIRVDLNASLDDFAGNRRSDSSVSHHESAYEGRGQSNAVSSATPRCVIVRERRVSLVT